MRGVDERMLQNAIHRRGQGFPQCWERVGTATGGESLRGVTLDARSAPHAVEPAPQAAAAVG